VTSPRIEERTGAGGWPALALFVGEAEVEVLPQRGALVSRYRVAQTEVLWLDESTVAEVNASVRGGIPLLFPNAGPLPNGQWRGGPLPQHGFARRCAFEVTKTFVDASTARIELQLTPNETSRAGYPFDFEATYAVSLVGEKLLLEWRLVNRSTVTMPWHFGLHPYFAAPDKTKARVDARGTRAWDNTNQRYVAYQSPEFEFGVVDLHLLDPVVPAVDFERGDGRTIRLEWSAPYSTLVMWTLPDKPFVCVEPWTAPTGALASEEGLQYLAPDATTACTVMISCNGTQGGFTNHRHSATARSPAPKASSPK
jgi:galactose mutarotase-like enzyme